MSIDNNISSMTKDIVMSCCAAQKVSPEALPGLVSSVRAALVGEAVMSNPAVSQEVKQEVVKEAVEKKVRKRTRRGKPAVDPRDSVHEDYIICLEDGRHLKTMARHLRVAFGLTPDEYRKKWGLPADYPMTARSYSAQRAVIARASGLGKNKDKKPQSDAS